MEIRFSSIESEVSATAKTNRVEVSCADSEVCSSAKLARVDTSFKEFLFEFSIVYNAEEIFIPSIVYQMDFTKDYNSQYINIIL